MLGYTRALNSAPQKNNPGAVEMKPKSALAIAIATLIGVDAYLATAFGQAGEESAPVYLTKVPAGYRDWKVISVAHEAGNLNSYSVVLGNDIAIEAYRAGKLPFPDGAIVAGLHYSYVPSEENNKVFGREQSFVPGKPTNIQFEVKDSKKYAATGGWGFGFFDSEGKPNEKAAVMKTCAPCHAKEAGFRSRRTNTFLRSGSRTSSRWTLARLPLSTSIFGTRINCSPSKPGSRKTLSRLESTASSPACRSPSGSCAQSPGCVRRDRRRNFRSGTKSSRPAPNEDLRTLRTRSSRRASSKGSGTQASGSRTTRCTCTLFCGAIANHSTVIC